MKYLNACSIGFAVASINSAMGVAAFCFCMMLCQISDQIAESLAAKTSATPEKKIFIP